jgi:hypothetical protein
MQRIGAAANVYNAVTGFNHTEDAAKWAEANPQGPKIIAEVDELRKDATEN